MVVFCYLQMITAKRDCAAVFLHCGRILKIGLIKVLCIRLNFPEFIRGKPVFIQNSYDNSTKQFCIQDLYVNDRKVPINPNSSAIKLDFTGLDEFVPVVIRIIHRDSVCRPVILNPDAITFHSVFGFGQIMLTDSTLTWQTKGEVNGAYYVVENDSEWFVE